MKYLLMCSQNLFESVKASIRRLRTKLFILSLYRQQEHNFGIFL